MNNGTLKNTVNIPQQPSSGNIDIFKYLLLIWQKKYWILLICTAVAIFWIVIYSMFLYKVEYVTSAVVRFDDPRLNRGVGAITDFAITDAYGKIAVLNTNSFLGRVVDSLHYDIMFPDYRINPTHLIKLVLKEKGARYGEYKLERQNNLLTVYYTNNLNNIKDSILQKSIIKEDSDFTFKGNGLLIQFRTSDLKKFSEVKFHFVPKSVAINILNRNLDRSLDRSQTILTINFKGKNPEYSALIVNTVATLFTKQLLDYKRLQTTSILSSLEGQLSVAQRELEIAENNLRSFRESHPFVYLANDRQQLVTNLSDLENTVNENSQKLETLKQLLTKLYNTKIFENSLYVYQELLAFLSSAEVPGATTFVEQYDQLVSGRQRLLNENYSAQHPSVIALEDQIRNLEEQVKQLAEQYQNQLTNSINGKKSEITEFNQNLKKLPRNELRLAELERNRQIKERIVSSIIQRMDEAKVTDAAVIPDAYVIDEAEPPLTQDGFRTKLKMYAIGPILGVLLGVAFFILVDIMDNSVRSADEIEHALTIPVLSTIPIIGEIKKKPDFEDLRKTIDSKLITADYAPTPEAEAFRRLRTKLRLNNTEKNFLTITSLNPDEGKSLVSCNLGIAFAQQKLTTLLLDCDLRRGVLHNSFGLDKKPGLSDFLMQDREIINEHVLEIIQQTHIPNLSLISSGTAVPNPSELLGGQKMNVFFNSLKDKYDVIILDSPPFRLVPDAFVLNGLTHQLLLVTRYGETKLKDLKMIIKEFGKIKKDILGIIINASDDLKVKETYKYSYYQY